MLDKTAQMEKMKTKSKMFTFCSKEWGGKKNGG